MSHYSVQNCFCIQFIEKVLVYQKFLYINIFMIYYYNILDLYTYDLYLHTQGHAKNLLVENIDEN